ncbi:hypothetical protein CHUAL_011229 [Chamberlinius hualienensis]
MELSIRKRIKRQITKYLNDCRTRDPDGQSLKSTFKSKLRKSPVPPPVPQPDYIAGATNENDYGEDWDTDFDDSDDEIEAEVEQPNTYTDNEESHSMTSDERNESPVCNGNQVSEIVKKLGLQPSPLIVTKSPEPRRRVGDMNGNSNHTPNVNGRVKPDIPRRKPMPRPPSSVVITNNAKSRPTSVVLRPQELPPPPPTAPKPNINFGSPKTVPTTIEKSYVDCEESPTEDCDAWDNYEVPVPTSSNASDNGLSSFEQRIGSSTISLLSGSSSLGNDDLTSPSQLELNRSLMDDEDYEIPSIDSQWSGSSGVSVRSTSSDRPVLPPKFRSTETNIPPPPLPEKPYNRRPIEPPILPARDKGIFNKKSTEDVVTKPRKISGPKPLLSSLFNTLGKRASSTSGVDMSPDKEFVPTTAAAIQMTKCPSLSSLRPTYTDTAALVNTRPLPPVPGERPDVDSYKDGYQENISNSSSSSSSSVGSYLETYPWFHKVERNEAETLLRQMGKSGSYLVRESRRAGECNPFTLTLYYNTIISHLNIRRRPDGTFALGKEKENEKTFTSVQELVAHHQTEQILLTSRGQAIGKVNLVQYPSTNRSR